MVRRRGGREDRRDASAHRGSTLEFAPELDRNQEDGPIATRSVFDERKQKRASLEERVATVLEAHGKLENLSSKILKSIARLPMVPKDGLGETQGAGGVRPGNLKLGLPPCPRTGPSAARAHPAASTRPRPPSRRARLRDTASTPAPRPRASSTALPGSGMLVPMPSA